MDRSKRKASIPSMSMESYTKANALFLEKFVGPEPLQSAAFAELFLMLRSQWKTSPVVVIIFKSLWCLQNSRVLPESSNINWSMELCVKILRVRPFTP